MDRVEPALAIMKPGKPVTSRLRHYLGYESWVSWSLRQTVISGVWRDIRGTMANAELHIKNYLKP